MTPPPTFTRFLSIHSENLALRAVVAMPQHYLGYASAQNFSHTSRYLSREQFRY